MLESVALLLLPLQTAEIDFVSKAAPIGEILRELSEATGTKLKATPAIAHEVVLIRAKSTDLTTIKVKLAEALQATWKQESDAEYLNRTPEQTRGIYTQHLKYRRKLVDEEMARIRKELEKPFDGSALAIDILALKSASEFENDPQGARLHYLSQEAIFHSGPLARLLRRLLLACNPDDLAAIGPYERRVFKVEPTRMQRAINRKEYAAALDAFEREQQDWIDAAAKVSWPEAREGRTVSDPRTQIKHSPHMAGVSLTVSRGDMMGLFFVNLSRPPVDGEANQPLAQELLQDPARRFINQPIVHFAPEKDDAALEFSPACVEFVTAHRKSFEGQPEQLSKTLLDLLMNPEKVEPLGLLPSEALLSYAELHDRNMVAVLPDSIMWVAAYIARSPDLRVNQFLRLLKFEGDVTLEDGPGWLFVAPSDRYEAVLAFTPRSAMGDLIRSVHSTGRLSLSKHATYAFRTGRLMRYGLGEMYLAMYDPSLQNTLDVSSWDGLRLYGSFSDQQRRQLEDGARLPFNRLTPVQRALVERIVYAGAIWSEERITEGTSRNNLNKSIEPTEALANGLPGGGVVYTSVTDTPTIFAYRKNSEGIQTILRPIEPWTVAQFEVEREADPERAKRYGLNGVTGYAMGNRKFISLRVEPIPGAWKECSMSEIESDPNPKPVPWDQLPDRIVNSIRVGIEFFKRERTEQAKRQPPPPPN